MLIPERSQNHSLMKFVLNGEVHRMTFLLLLGFNCHVKSSTCIISALWWTAWYPVVHATWKRRRGAKVKSEDNLQGDNSFNGLQIMIFFVSFLAQVAKHQMTVLSTFGVHICITFWVELNVNEVLILQAIFSWRLLHTSNIVFKNVPPLVIFGSPCCDILATALHPTCWASSQWIHTISRTLCHGAWTPAPLSAHPPIKCRCTTRQIDTTNCTCRTTTHQFFSQPQNTCGALGGSPMECGMGIQPHKTPYFHSWHQYPPSRNDPPKKSLGPAQMPPHWCRTFPLLLVQMGYGLFCGLWVWHRRTNRRPCCPPMSNLSTSPWTAWPDGSGRWDNRMAAQHLPWNLARPSSG